MSESPVELLRAVEEISQLAAQCQMRYFGQIEVGDVGFKGRRDLVTDADRETEAVIVGEIRKRFPHHAILAEETLSSGGDGVAPDTPLWIIDPIDGTTNFVHSHPFFASSIAVCLDGAPQAACVLAPKLDECYTASLSGGAQLNGRPIHVTRTTDIADSLLATGFAYRVGEHADNNLDRFGRIVKEVRAMRRCGSAALDLCFVAAGRYDGYWELELSPWDMAAGALIVREAGGVVTDIVGGDDWLFGRSILSAAPGLFEDLLRRL